MFIIQFLKLRTETEFFLFIFMYILMLKMKKHNFFSISFVKFKKYQLYREMMAAQEIMNLINFYNLFMFAEKRSGVSM